MISKSLLQLAAGLLICLTLSAVDPRFAAAQTVVPDETFGRINIVYVREKSPNEQRAFPGSAYWAADVNIRVTPNQIFVGSISHGLVFPRSGGTAPDSATTFHTNVVRYRNGRLKVEPFRLIGSFSMDDAMEASETKFCLRIVPRNGDRPDRFDCILESFERHSTTRIGTPTRVANIGIGCSDFDDRPLKAVAKSRYGAVD